MELCSGEVAGLPNKVERAWGLEGKEKRRRFYTWLSREDDSQTMYPVKLVQRLRGR